MSLYKRYFLINLLLLIASGCASGNRAPQNLPTDSVIAQKVAIAVKAQQDYQLIVRENSHSKNHENGNFNTDIVDVDYIGKPLPILKALSNKYGFRFVEIGKKTDLRILNIRMEHVLPIDVLENISKQIDYATDVVLDKESNTLKIIYK